MSPAEEATGLLIQGLELLGIPASALQMRQLETHRRELERWNRARSLVRAEGDEVVVRHFLDTLSALEQLRRLEPRREILDVGSGAGFPGLPLAVFLEDSRFTLLERSARKCAFLRNVAVLAGLQARVRVFEGQLADLAKLEVRFDLAVSRAFSPLGRQLEALRALLEPSGRLAAYKGRRMRIEEEIAGLAGASVLELRVPFLEAERHLVVIGL